MPDAAIELPPISEEAPCGPDLDLEGDTGFMGYMATSEAPLPTSTSNSPGERGSYFNFNPKDYDLPGMIAEGDRFLARTQDIRLLILLAKISILRRDFVDFVQRIETIVWLLANRWEFVHPQAEEGEYFNRLAQLGSLDDLPAVALPLQYAPLIETRRDGPLAFRAHLVQTGEAKPRDGELLASQSAMDRILSTVELETLEASAARAERLSAALKSLTTITSEKVGPGDAVKLRVLGPLVEKIRAFFAAALVKRNPSAAAADEYEEAPEAAAGPATNGGAAAALTPLDTFEGIDAALGAALGYFATREPSSPALLLIRQAREALGKNLYDVMRLLAPTHADNARVFVGPDGAFTVPVSALSDGPALDISRADPEPAPSRTAALSQIDAVATHLRRTEPSSPLPYLLDRARILATRDFLSLLHELLPEDDIASLKSGK
jgi:type VI secretion system protein ImpA